MTTISLAPTWPSPGALLRECHRRQPALTLFALAMLAAMVPALVALGLDSREIRGVNVWVKPLKFMASVALFAASTAWFVGLLPEARRRAGLIRGLAAVIIVAGTLEIAYIVLQAALGQASHFNTSDRLHALLYQAMGGGALAMCITQGVLALQIGRHGRSDLAPVWRAAVVRGLWLTLVLGALAGAVLASVQPPPGMGLPLTGWHGQADLRPAHFVGMHAQQFLPLAGLALMGQPTLRARRLLDAFTVAYVLLWLGVAALGLQGAQFVPPMLPPR